jgi:hypothetical protein
MNIETAFGPVVFDDVGCEAFEYVRNAFKSLDFARIESTGQFYYAEAFRDDLSEHVSPKDQFDFVIETARVTNWGGGLNGLPSWVRTHRRVHRWVQAKLIFTGLRRQISKRTYVA